MDELAICLDAGRFSIQLAGHSSFVKVWSTEQIPGEMRTFSVWRPDLRAAGFSLVQHGFQSLVGGSAGVRVVFGDVGVRGVEAPESCLVLKIKCSESSGSAGPGLQDWLDR